MTAQTYTEKEFNPTKSPTPDMNDSKFRLFGSLVIGIVFIGFGGWSYLAPLESAAPAIGMVVVKNEKKVLQHLEGGILKKLWVREGDEVDLGQIVASLDPTSLQANLDVLQFQHQVLLAQEARLEAERSGKDKINFGKNLMLGDGQFKEILEEQRMLFQKRNNSLKGEISILKQRITQVESSILGLKEEKKTKAKLLNSYESEYSNLASLMNEGFVDEARVRDFERRIVEFKGQMQNIDSQLQTAQIQIGETELQILQRTAVFDADVQVTLTDLQSSRTQLEESLRIIEDRLSRLDILAPVAGTVLTVAVTTEGGVISPGQPFVTIVPKGEDLMVEATITPIDVDRINIGSEAELQFQAFDANTLPKIYGRVESISADALLDRGNGMTYYSATLSIPPSELDKLARNELLPGMPVNVLIKTGERTLFEYMVKPLSQGLSQALIED